ncbi:hypothetical protein MMC28_011546 [Mycoblastus sanguinarius]|nr:hypothetical protein [Mycoblastus sanguinarius]
MAKPQETFTEAQYYTIIWVLSSIALAFLVSRILIRLKVDRRLNIDDGLVILAMTCLLVSDILNSIMAPQKFIVQGVKINHDPKPVNYGDISASFAKCQWADAYIFFTCIWAVKGSFLAYYDGLTQRLTYYRRAWWFVIGFTILTYIGSLFAYAFLDGLSIQVNLKNKAIEYQFAADFITDILITIIPLSIAMKSRVPTKQKLFLVGIFSLSLIITIFSIIRFALNAPTRGTAGPSWIDTWSAVEQSVSVTVACLASFRTLVISNSRTLERSYSRHPQQRVNGTTHGKIQFATETLGSSQSHRDDSMDIELLETNSSKALAQ